MHVSICCKNLHVGACVAALLCNKAIFYESEEKVSQRLSFFLKNERALCRESTPLHYTTHRRTTRSQNFVFMITIPQRDNFQTKQTEHQKEMCLEALQRAASPQERGSSEALQPQRSRNPVHANPTFTAVRKDIIQIVRS